MSLETLTDPARITCLPTQVSFVARALEARSLQSRGASPASPLLRSPRPHSPCPAPVLRAAPGAPLCPL